MLGDKGGDEGKVGFGKGLGGTECFRDFVPGGHVV